MSLLYRSSSDKVSVSLYLLMTRLLGLFLYYNYVKGYPVKIKGEVKDEEIRDVYNTGYLIARTIAIKDVISTLKNVPIELLYEIEYESIIDREVKGLIDYPQTIRLLASGKLLIASISPKRKFETPEIILLSNVFYEIKDLIKNFEEQIEDNNQLLKEALSLVINDLKNSINKVYWIIESIGLFEKMDYDSLLKLCDLVMDRGIYGYYHVAKSFKKYILTIKALNKHLSQYRGPQGSKERLGIEFEKVFELYTYYLIVFSLLRSLSSIRVTSLTIDNNDNYISITVLRNNNSIEYRVYHDRGFEDKSWLSSNLHASNNVLRASRPDITITINQGGKEEIIFVSDAKHRLELKSVFRELRIVLGYMNEYNVNKGAILFNSSYANESVNKPLTISNEEKYAAIIPIEISLSSQKLDEIDKIIDKHMEIISKYVIKTIL